MRFVSLVNSALGKARRAVSQGLSMVGDKPEPNEVTEQLRQVMLRLNKIEVTQPPEATEFEVNLSTAGALVELRHGFNGPTRWWVTKWLQTSGVGYPVSGPSLAEDSSSTAATLFLRSYVAGRAVIRVELSQSYVEPGVIVAGSPLVAPGSFGYGTFANRPAAGSAGRIYITTDGPLSFYDDGATWQPLPFHGQYRSTPAVSSFTTIQAGGRSTTISDSKGGILMSMTNGAAANDYRIIKVASPSAPYSLTVHVTPMLMNANYSGAGICWRASASGNCKFFGFVSIAGAYDLMARYETASGTGASPTFTYVNDTALAIVPHAEMGMGDGVWLRITDDSTNRTYWYSLDGQNFMRLASELRTADITPNEVGLWVANVNNAGSAANSIAFFDSWTLA